MQKEPTAEPLLPSVDYPGRKMGTRLDKHLYSDEAGAFYENFEKTSWEWDVLAEELPKSEVVGWLRNLPRKDWSLCIPYDEGGETKSLYPDFIIFRKVNRKVVVDILDPHTSSFSDAIPKAKGLANYAEKHGAQFERIELIHKVSGRLKRLDLKDEVIRKKILKATERTDLDKLFDNI